MKFKNLVTGALVASLSVATLAGCGADSKSSSDASASSSAGGGGTSVSTGSVVTTSGGVSKSTNLNYPDLTGQDIVIGISTGSAGTSWRDQGIEDQKKVLDEYKSNGDIKDYKIVNNTTNGDANEQASIIRNFIDDPDVNVILFNPNDTTALNEAVEDAEAAGKLCVAYDATITAEGALNVSNDHYEYAYEPTVKLCEMLGGKGSVVEISGLDGHPANNIRIQATDDALAKYPDITLDANQPGGWDNTQAKSVMASMLSSGIKPDGIISQDAECYGILQACLDADYLPKVMNGDGTKAFFEEWKKIRDEGKDFNAIVVPNPPGIAATAVRIAVKMAQGRHLDEEKLEGNTYMYKVTSYYTNDNFDDAWEKVKDLGDEETLDEVISEEDANKLFVD